MSISPYNFEQSFELYIELTRNCFEDLATWIQLRLKDSFAYVTTAEDCSALLLEDPSWFSLSKSSVGSFECKKLGVTFSVYNNGTELSPDFVLGIGYVPTNIQARNIILLTSRLRDLGIIYSK